MNSRLIYIAVLLFASSIINASINVSPELIIKSVPQPQNKFEEVVEIFLIAVDRGELVVFDKTITRSMLDPIQVKYVYTSDVEDPTISVYSFLLQPLKIPGVDDCTAGGIEAILDIDGSIIDSSIHIQSK